MLSYVIFLFLFLYVDRSNRVEESSQKENQQLLKEAQKEIRERDEKLDELRMEYETKLKVFTVTWVHTVLDN